MMLKSTATQRAVRARSAKDVRAADHHFSSLSCKTRPPARAGNISIKNQKNCYLSSKIQNALKKKSDFFFVKATNVVNATNL